MEASVGQDVVTEGAEEEAATASGEGTTCYEDFKGEVLRFPSLCHACGAPAETLMKPTGMVFVSEGALICLIATAWFQTSPTSKQ